MLTIFTRDFSVGSLSLHTQVPCQGRYFFSLSPGAVTQLVSEGGSRGIVRVSVCEWGCGVCRLPLGNPCHTALLHASEADMKGGIEDLSLPCIFVQPSINRWVLRFGSVRPTRTDFYKNSMPTINTWNAKIYDIFRELLPLTVCTCSVQYRTHSSRGSDFFLINLTVCNRLGRICI